MRWVSVVGLGHTRFEVLPASRLPPARRRASPGIYRFTASRGNTDGNFFIDVIELASGSSRSVGIYGRGESGGQEDLTIYGPDRSFGLKAGNYLLYVDTDHDWSVRVELVQAH